MAGSRRRATLTGSALSSAVAQWTQPGIVKSVQQSTIDLNGLTSKTATITSVVTANALIFHQGASYGASTADPSVFTLIALTNATTVTASDRTALGAAMPVGFVVIEFVPGVLKYVQRGTIDVNGGTTATAAITSPVNTLKAFVTSLGFVPSLDPTFDFQKHVPRLALTNGTTITMTVGANPTVSMTMGYQVAEFY